MGQTKQGQRHDPQQREHTLEAMTAGESGSFRIQVEDRNDGDRLERQLSSRAKQRVETAAMGNLAGWQAG